MRHCLKSFYHAQINIYQMCPRYTSFAKISLIKDDSAEVGFVEVGFAEVGSLQVGSAEVGIVEVGFAEVGFEEDGSAEVGSAEVGFAKVGSLQHCSLQVGSKEVGFAEVGSAEVWLYISVFVPPWVPSFDALFEQIKVLPIRHAVLPPVCCCHYRWLGIAQQGLPRFRKE